MPTDFSTVLASLTTTRDGAQVVVPDDWLQGRTVFGGLQMALAVRAMRFAMPGDLRTLPLRSAHVTFIGPIGGGQPVGLQATVLRRGRSTVHARCDLLQGAAVAASAIGIFGAARASPFVREMRPPDPGRRADDPSLPTLKERFAPAFTRHFEMRWARGDVPYSGCVEPRSMIYARLRDRECGAEDALLALSDVIPTPVLSMLEWPAAVSSMGWMVEILRDPVALDLHEWSLIDTDVRTGTDGYLSQTSVLYGPDGHACSVSHQTVGVFA